jgi:hypothetical protein
MKLYPKKKKKAKYNLYILLKIRAAPDLVGGSDKSLSEMVIMIVINYF